MRLEDVGLVGNCQFAALIDKQGSVVWCCLPRFDSEPVFGSLLHAEGGGRFQIIAADGSAGTQRYLDSTNVLETRFDTAEGAFRILDFAPRFEQHGRSFRPTMLMRIVEPLAGTPRMRVICDPRLGWSNCVPDRIFGSHHVAYGGFNTHVRLTTDVSLSWLDGRPVALTQRRYFAFTWGQPVEEPLEPLCERFFRETVAYWTAWVKHCTIPAYFQQEVIRSALVLKLHCFEDTGAIVAAITTSIPESPGSGRTWDYRYCWLRDAYYVLAAFRLLGHYEEREQFLTFLLNIASAHPEQDLVPIYRVDGAGQLEERILENWPGFNNDGPVRVGNDAAKYAQNDIFGEMVLALTPIFLDDRFTHDRSDAALGLMERLARRAIETAGTPDAGIWEYRSEWKPQTFSSLMCWAAADRMAMIAERHRLDRAMEWRRAAEGIREDMLRRAWNPNLQALVATYGGNELDASLLQAAALRFLPPNDERLVRTIDAIRRVLSHNGWLMRYRMDDGLGHPNAAFLICTFWLVEALEIVGRPDEAAEVFRATGTLQSPLGLLSEDCDPTDFRLWGNFPQAYSHVGLINAAFAASPDWREVL